MTRTPHPGPERPAAPDGPADAKLGFSTPSGHRRTARARFGPESRRDPHLPQLIRNALLDDRGQGQRCVQVRLSAADATEPAARALLDTEAGTALRLHKLVEGTEFAPLFPRLIGYELDTDEPFLLYDPPRGATAAKTHVMSSTDQRVLTRDLMLALSLLDDQGLVPRGISPATVLWDGTALQLWGLEGVTAVGRPRTPWGQAPYASPEQRRSEGLADSRDAVWSAAQVLYRLVTGRPGHPDRAPADLAEHRVLNETLSEAFAPRATGRPTPAQLLGLLSPGTFPRATVLSPSDVTRQDREVFEQALRAKRQAPVAPSTVGAGAGLSDSEVLCPYCLETIQLDLGALYVTDSRMQYQPLNLAGVGKLRRQDVMRGAVQKCTADPDFPEHFIPVPYLTYGRPLTVAMVGQSSTGKSHLLTQMIAEITDGGLEPFGLTWQSVNPEQHARFVRERVQPLRNGRVLDHTTALGLDGFARFVESLLITDAHGQVRPVAFFDLGGGDLVRTDAALRFLLGVDALVFVVDPVLALPLPQLDHARERGGVEVNRDGDLAFATVLDRLPKTGPYLEVAATMVLGKADLLRFRSPVDHWLGQGRPAALDPVLMRDESQDVHAFLRRHAGQAWLRPFDAIRRCTLHVASATGGQEDQGRTGRPSTVSHVLVGPPCTLKTRQCLGLAYGGWGARELAERATGSKPMVECSTLDASGPLARLTGSKPPAPCFERQAAARLVDHLLANREDPPGVPQLTAELSGGATLDWARRRDLLGKILSGDRRGGGHTQTPKSPTEREQRHQQQPYTATPPYRAPRPTPDPTPPPSPSPPRTHTSITTTRSNRSNRSNCTKTCVATSAEATCNTASWWRSCANCPTRYCCTSSAPTNSPRSRWSCFCPNWEVPSAARNATRRCSTPCARTYSATTCIWHPTAGPGSPCRAQPWPAGRPTSSTGPWPRWPATNAICTTCTNCCTA
ncbi:hypothetical protein RB628_18535 [Streptomyces sp. ADMS]|uniref:hypothetical protein n=1 Tax=Streptomyces sp. ADMS TaxID=3071415 RepID=UPI00296F0BC8|nr:hypothetical protein [Streptomyces sp. ADMS]MDW4907295.1 hypothetical protein [Streptomyces sp. ADMS]